MNVKLFIQLYKKPDVNSVLKRQFNHVFLPFQNTFFFFSSLIFVELFLYVSNLPTAILMNHEIEMFLLVYRIQVNQKRGCYFNFRELGLYSTDKLTLQNVNAKLNFWN